MIKKVIFEEGKNKRPIARIDRKIIIPKFPAVIGEEWEVSLEDKGNYYFAHPIKKIIDHTPVDLITQKVSERSGKNYVDYPIIIKENDIYCSGCNKKIGELPKKDIKNIKIYPQIIEGYKKALSKSPTGYSCPCGALIDKKFKDVECPRCNYPVIDLKKLEEVVPYKTTLTIDKLKEHFRETLEPLPFPLPKHFTYGGEITGIVEKMILLPSGELYSIDKDPELNRIYNFSYNYDYPETRWKELVPELKNTNFNVVSELKDIKDIPTNLKTYWFDIDLKFNPRKGSYPTLGVDLHGEADVFLVPCYYLFPEITWKKKHKALSSIDIKAIEDIIKGKPVPKKYLISEEKEKENTEKNAHVIKLARRMLLNRFL